MIFLDFVLPKISMIKILILLVKNPINDPTKVFFENRDGYSKRERMGMIDLHLKHVFIG